MIVGTRSGLEIVKNKILKLHMPPQSFSTLYLYTHRLSLFPPSLSVTCIWLVISVTVEHVHVSCIICFAVSSFHFHFTASFRSPFRFPCNCLCVHSLHTKAVPPTSILFNVARWVLLPSTFSFQYFVPINVT